MEVIGAILVLLLLVAIAFTMIAYLAHSAVGAIMFGMIGYWILGDIGATIGAVFGAAAGFISARGRLRTR